MSRWSHSHTCTVPATPRRVFAALVDPDALRCWFAEHVEVDPRPYGTFRFWGRHTYGAPRRDDASQRILRIETPRELFFSWPFAGQQSGVEWTLAPSTEVEHATRFTVKHWFPAPLAVPRAAELIDDLWRLMCGNLIAHVRGNGGVFLPDFTDPRPQVRISEIVDAPRERVFEALMDPATLDRWIGAAGTEAVVEPIVGGRYSYGWTSDQNGLADVGPTRILELVPNEKLVTDWPDWRGDPSVPPQTVTWLLEPVGERTRVTIVHSGFVRASDISDYPHGWLAFGERLRKVLS